MFGCRGDLRPLCNGVVYKTLLPLLWLPRSLKKITTEDRVPEFSILELDAKRIPGYSVGE